MAFPTNVRVPRPTVIGKFSEEANEVSSGNVTVLDTNTVNIKAFSCDCSQLGAFLAITKRRFIGLLSKIYFCTFGLVLALLYYTRYCTTKLREVG